MSVNHSVLSGGIIDTSNMNVCCVFSLESPHRGDSNEYTQYTILNMKKKRKSALATCIPNLHVCYFFPKNEFETAVVNEPSVFEPLKVYCIYFMQYAIY